MHLFITLGSPHIGYMYNKNKLIDTGIWIIKKWKKCKSLIQLTCDDNKDMEQTFMYNLS